MHQQQLVTKASEVVARLNAGLPLAGRYAGLDLIVVDARSAQVIDAYPLKTANTLHQLTLGRVRHAGHVCL